MKGSAAAKLYHIKSFPSRRPGSLTFGRMAVTEWVLAPCWGTWEQLCILQRWALGTTFQGSKDLTRGPRATVGMANLVVGTSSMPSTHPAHGLSLSRGPSLQHWGNAHWHSWKRQSWELDPACWPFSPRTEVLLDFSGSSLPDVIVNVVQLSLEKFLLTKKMSCLKCPVMIVAKAKEPPVHTEMVLAWQAKKFRKRFV